MGKANYNQGGASAAPPALMPEAVTPAEVAEAIDHVHDPAEAEDLLRRVTSAAEVARIMQLGEEQARRWARLPLVAERRWGQLLGPGKPGNPNVPGGHIPDTERKARMKARQVAAVPQRVFDLYLDTAPKPTRSGLLRAAAPPAPKPKRPKRRSGRRLREVTAARRGKVDPIADVQWEVLKLTRILESLDLEDYDLDNPDNADAVVELHADLVEALVWIDRAISSAQARLSDVALAEQIRRLREDHAGRTPAEIEAFLAAADRLERKREARLQPVR